MESGTVQRDVKGPQFQTVPLPQVPFYRIILLSLLSTRGHFWTTESDSDDFHRMPTLSTLRLPLWLSLGKVVALMLRHIKGASSPFNAPRPSFAPPWHRPATAPRVANKDAAPRPSLCAPLRSSPRHRRPAPRKQVRRGPATACSPKASLAPAPRPCAPSRGG